MSGKSSQSVLAMSFTLFEEIFLCKNIPLTLCVLGIFSACILSMHDPSFLSASLFGSGGSEPVFSGGGLDEGAQLVQDNIEGTGLVDEGSIIDVVIWIIKFILIFAGILALFAFIWAGFLYITTFVNDDNHETAKKVMLYAAIGILIIIFSWVIVQFLTTFEF